MITVELMLQSSPDKPPAHFARATFPTIPVTPCGMIVDGDEYHAVGQAWVVETSEDETAILQVLLRSLKPVQTDLGLVLPVRPGIIR